MDKISFKIFLVAIFSAIVIFCSTLALSLFFKEEKVISTKYVTNPNIFYTVESCVNKYVGLVIAGEREAVFNVIDEGYKSENNITIYDVLNINYAIDGNYTFVAKKMLEDKNKNHVYYVKGYLIEDNSVDDLVGKRKDYGVIVMLHSNNTYSIIPNISEVEEQFNET